MHANASPTQKAPASIQSLLICFANSAVMAAGSAAGSLLHLTGFYSAQQSAECHCFVPKTPGLVPAAVTVTKLLLQDPCDTAGKHSVTRGAHAKRELKNRAREVPGLPEDERGVRERSPAE